jgi:Uroporphyrinogen-III decarboxylase
MNDLQWESLKAAVEGRSGAPTSAFIVDCPWLPGWRGRTILDYFGSDEIWLEANFSAIERFPDAAFIPGFWSEYGMCTEPSAFGAKCVFPENEFPFAKSLGFDESELDSIEEPDPEKDGLLPFAIRRMKWAEPRMAERGHRFRFSVSRGPLNIASFLMGMTELMIAMKTEPEKVKGFLARITSFLGRWHSLQRSLFPSIDGIMILDDIVGFIGEEDFLEFGLPYLKELYAPAASVKLFHNDADCAASVRYYPEIGINLYNPGVQMPLGEIVEKTGGRMAVLGAIPPRDVLASLSPAEVAAAVRAQEAALPAKARLVRSCAGGMPPGVSSESIDAFLGALRRSS